jgi:LPXTG-site transpeptidase (sortase) family protein
VPTVTPSDAPVTPPPGIVARRIRISRLGINLQIVEGDGTEAPMGKAAHYPGTGWPGGGVNIYLYAHAQTGMFLTLWDAKVGDDVFLDLKDGTTRHYVVTVVIPKVPWDALKYVAATAPERLTLQTSTSYTPTAPRFIVLAEPVPDASPSAAPSQ